MMKTGFVLWLSILLTAIMMATAACNGGQKTESSKKPSPAVTTVTPTATGKTVTPAAIEPEETTEAPTFVLTEDPNPVIRTKAEYVSKWFRFAYSTNQEKVTMECSGPDGSMTDFELEGPVENKGWLVAILPTEGQVEESNTCFAGYMALPGVYTWRAYTVPDYYSEEEPVKIFEKQYTFRGASLQLKEAGVNDWDWLATYPVCLFSTKDTYVTIENNGDLPSYASVLLNLDDSGTCWEGLGFVGAGESRTFPVYTSFTFDTDYTGHLNGPIPSTSHTMRIRLVSLLPPIHEYSHVDPDYYGSARCPYKVVNDPPDNFGLPYYLRPDYDTFLYLDELTTGIYTPELKIK